MTYRPDASTTLYAFAGSIFGVNGRDLAVLNGDVTNSVNVVLRVDNMTAAKQKIVLLLILQRSSDEELTIIQGSSQILSRCALIVCHTAAHPQVVVSYQHGSSLLPAARLSDTRGDGSGNPSHSGVSRCYLI